MELLRRKLFYSDNVNFMHNAVLPSPLWGDKRGVLNLDTLASLCVAQYGAMVHQARVLYNIVFDNFRLFDDNCEEINNNSKLQQWLPGIPAKEYNFLLFPNPARDQLFISLPQGEEKVFVEIQDVNGRIIFKDEVISENNLCEIKLDIENGVYLVNLKTENISEVQKIVITK